MRCKASFPPAQVGGPIEAVGLYMRDYMTAGDAFHRLRSVAPLKRVKVPSLRTHPPGFPPAQVGGPIEATPIGSGSMTEWTFHRLRSVAPLKLWKLRRVRCDCCCFPPAQVGGPIEARLQKRG